MKKLFLFFVAILTYHSLFSQNTINQDNPDQLFLTGVELLDKEKYGAARHSFERYLEENNHDDNKAIEASYYIAYSALRLYHADGEKLVENFIHNNEGHPKALQAYYEMGNFYFREKNYTKAIKYLEKVNLGALSKTQKIETQFKIAYSHFTRKDFAKALEQFNQIKASENRYTYAASYYAGFIEYRNGEYAAALTDLKRAEGNESYAAVVPYMITNVYYKQKDYDGMLQYAESAVKRPNLQNEDEIYLLIAEAYYMKENYAEAAKNFEDYLANKKGKPDADVLFRIGYSQYMSGNNENAIDNFKVVAASGDTLGQFASYYLGELYIKQDNKIFATAAFDVASKQNFVPEIKEQALFKLGKVNFDIEKYGDAITIFNRYLKEYPKSENTAEVNDLLSEAYLNSNDYAQAIKHIESLPTKSTRVKQAYQKVTFFKGTEFFNNAKFYNAVQMFEKSLEYPLDEEFVVRAHFWSGEAYTTGKKYDEAIASYSAVFRNTNEDNIYHLKSRYGIGYSYFNKKEYEKALPHFRAYVEKLQNAGNKLFYKDAVIRLADCYYTTKSYSNALRFYNEAIKENNPEMDYAYYQLGVIEGIQGNYESAKEHLTKVVNQYASSRYVDDALFELAQLNFEQGNYDAAIAGFTKIIDTKQQSEFVPYALLRRAIANFNLQKYEQTSADYKAILDDYITHELANSALAGLQQVLTQLGKSDEFDRYLSQYKVANPDNEALSSIEFDAAKNLYFSQKYDRAVENLSEFIKQYPNTADAYEAKYYLAESYYRLNNIDEAIDTYKIVIEDNKISQVARAIQRVGELEFQRKNFDEAIKYFTDLATIARSKREQNSAWTGLMESYFAKNEFDSVAYYAKLILEKGNVNANAESKANLYLGKAAYSQGNNDEAVDYFLTTLNTAKDENGAEAKYLLAEIQYKQGDFKKSIETLYDLNTNYSSYEKWLSKSFLLIADNYIALDENFQAKATLKSLIEKSPIPEIVEQAKNKLKLLEEEENQAQKMAEEQLDTTTFEVIEDDSL